MKLVFFLPLTFFTFSAFAQEPAWWTKQKRDCGLASNLAYNTWVAQGMPCKTNQQTIQTGPTPEELKRQRELKDTKDASDDSNDKGIDFYKKSDWSNAIKYFTEALDYNPDNEDARDNLKKAQEKANLEAQRREAQRQQDELRRKQEEQQKKENLVQEEKKNSIREKYNKYMREADNIVVPPPSWESMIAEDIRQLRLGQKDNKYLMMADNAFMAAFDVVSKTPGTKTGLGALAAFKVLVIGAKSLIAAQDEAEIIVFTKNAMYERILILLKDKSRGPHLIAAIKSIHEKTPMPADISPELVRLAMETQNPALGNSSTHLVMNAMLSKEAKAAFFQTAKMEGMELLNSGLRGIVGTAAQSRFAALRDVNDKIELGHGYLKEEKDPVMRSLISHQLVVLERKMESFEKIPEQVLSLMSLYEDNKKINESE